MRVGFIGIGKMGEAMAASLIGGRKAVPRDIVASDASEARRRRVRRDLRISVTSRNRTVVRSADVVFLAVKPQDLDAVLAEICPEVCSRHMVLSIAAGRTLSSIQSRLPDARVVRVMPNTPCTVGEGMSVFCMGRGTTAADRGRVLSLLSCFGRVMELPETSFDVVTAVSGSGPAFVARFLDALAGGGVREGLSRGDALKLAEQTMLGTVRLLLETGLDPAELVKAVASPKGTTFAGLDVMDRAGFDDVVARTVRAAARRSRELSTSS